MAYERFFVRHLDEDGSRRTVTTGPWTIQTFKEAFGSEIEKGRQAWEVKYMDLHTPPAEDDESFDAFLNTMDEAFKKNFDTVETLKAFCDVFLTDPDYSVEITEVA